MRVGDVRAARVQEARDPGHDPGPVGAADQQPRGVAGRHYSVRLNSQIAIAEHRQAEHRDDRRLEQARDAPAEPGHAGVEPAQRAGADVEVGEDGAPHRVDRVGQRVEAVEDLQPAPAGPRAGTARRTRKNIGMISICISAMNDWICVMRAADHHAERGERERQQQLQREDARAISAGE